MSNHAADVIDRILMLVNSQRIVLRRVKKVAGHEMSFFHLHQGRSQLFTFLLFFRASWMKGASLGRGKRAWNITGKLDPVHRGLRIGNRDGAQEGQGIWMSGVAEKGLPGAISTIFPKYMTAILSHMCTTTNRSQENAFLNQWFEGSSTPNCLFPSSIPKRSQRKSELSP